MNAMHELEMINPVKAYFLADFSILAVYFYYFNTQGIWDIWKYAKTSNVRKRRTNLKHNTHNTVSEALYISVLV